VQQFDERQQSLVRESQRVAGYCVVQAYTVGRETCATWAVLCASPLQHRRSLWSWRRRLRSVPGQAVRVG